MSLTDYIAGFAAPADGSESQLTKPASHWYSARVRPEECSILREVVYDPDKLVFGEL